MNIDAILLAIATGVFIALILATLPAKNYRI
jgi:hypothetical protein